MHRYKVKYNNHTLILNFIQINHQKLTYVANFMQTKLTKTNIPSDSEENQKATLHIHVI